MVGILDEYNQKFAVNSRVRFYQSVGTVKYVGEVQGYNGAWLGVEWDDSSRGKHNGCVNNVAYFITDKPNSGTMIRPEKISKFETLCEAINERYVFDAENSLDENLLREAQGYCHASVFEIVGMEKLAKKQRCIGDLKDISVAYSNVNSAGCLDALKSLVSLNLTNTLIWNFQTVADIARQISTLTHIDLSCNRFEMPQQDQIAYLEKNFRHIKHINLSKCNLNNWSDILFISQLWPSIESLSLQSNGIEQIAEDEYDKIFLNLKELDLNCNKLWDFEEIYKLGKIKPLKSLLLMENGIKFIQLPSCEYNKCLQIFPKLEKLNLSGNPIQNEIYAFNELDKLPLLNSLSVCILQKNDCETFELALALIQKLKILNKTLIANDERRGAEYELWKKLAIEWKNACNSSEKKQIMFYNKYRAYAQLIKKYGSPPEPVSASKNNSPKLMKLRIINITGESFEKRVPRKLTVQTLQGLIIKYFKTEKFLPKLRYIGAKNPELVVELDNCSKSLDFYSIEDGDTIFVEWHK